LAGRGLGALLELDERLVNRVDGPATGPLDASAPPWAAALRDGWSDVRDELDDLLRTGVRLPETDDLTGTDQGATGRWTTYVMHWYGKRLDANCRRCPRTTALLAQVPGLQVAGFTVLDGHTHIPRHRGPAKSYRWQMGMRVPEPAGSCRLQIGDEVVVWEEGATLAFDDRTEHEAWNDADEPRYVLFVQVPWTVNGFTRVTHRATHRLFATATRRIPKQAASLDRTLNPRR
jgi:aspartyl/asparaginyl beta-hydroxylase (cupin superfamily)